MLIETLEKQLALHKSLLALAQAKTEAIKQNKMDELNRIVRDEQKHVSAIMILEKKRTEHSGQTLTELLPSLSAEERQGAEEIRGQLITVLQELQRTNRLNEELLDQSLQFVHLQLDLLAPPEAGNYAPDGDSDQTPSAGPIFDSKA
ncbi:flagellar protein FlgN [Domibacillus sp. DTU_2020_1001157_1_SI_ALB_TIR_016]|uniref:flagellar protein FlgN n=1 Tax=Domibacillus sp. DTU_2020_1001157_1_SI_ALB_TIR_016 TaxID=3077789 RepID=UPI0028ECA4BD|nr:flagellar protein FlgN [Domibacillus sp. DTU_2020_1001157_1_SI_ALB_TIR_016]WNS81296.1 flagellar protein FlgN [Domibacillus sp. DTU_2020_1001157_1_SI_ALB_TIR_016]